MKADYIWGLVKNQKESILSLSTPYERIRSVIEIIESAPISPNTPLGFEFIETMNIESEALLQVLRMYEKSGKCLVVPNEFSIIEVEHVKSVLKNIYDLCELNFNKEV